METWKILESIFKKPLEQIIDITTGKWICPPCKEKRKFYSEEAVLKALKEKDKEIKNRG